MTIALYNCSLNPSSKSRILGNLIQSEFAKNNQPLEVFNCDENPLPLCDGGASYGNENVQKANALGESAEGIIITTPIYNYTVNSTVKTLIEHVGRGWTGKVVGFAAAAGGFGSYMALMQTANSLMLDFRCIILPRFIYATESAFTDGKLTDEGIQERLPKFASEFTDLTSAVSGIQ